MPRIGIIGLSQESNTFLSKPTTYEHFANEMLVEGEELTSEYAGTHHEIAGFLSELEAQGAETVPIFMTKALPFGTIVPEAYTKIEDRLLHCLKHAGKLDGLLLAPHGATVSANFPDADGRWMEQVRGVVGPNVPVVATLDPHANLSQLMVDSVDALAGYRTNPHIDQAACGVEAAKMLLGHLRGDWKLTQAASFPPVAINIERQCTNEHPLVEVLAHFDRVRKLPQVISASLMLGFPYADVAEMGSAAVVVTNGNRSLAQDLSNELGQVIWDYREPLRGQFITVPEGVAMASSMPGPVCLLDMGDNVGGGSPGDGTLLAIELQRVAETPAFVCIYDPEAVAKCAAAGVGNVLTLAVGGKTDNLHGSPLVDQFTVKQVFDGKFQEHEPRHGGQKDFDMGLTAVIQTARGLTVMITSERVVPVSLQQLLAFGIDPKQFQYIVAKGVNAPLAAYKPVCPSIVRVNTSGVTVADMTLLNFRHRRKPMYPFELNTYWAAPSTGRGRDRTAGTQVKHVPLAPHE